MGLLRPLITVITTLAVLMEAFRLDPGGGQYSTALDWYEAEGPLDRCDRQTDGESVSGDRTVLGNRRASIINVCKQSIPGDEKCICTRRNSTSSVYRLECGYCIDPCAMQFVPLPTNSGNSNELTRTMQAMQMASTNRGPDWMDLLLNEFLNQVTTDTPMNMNGSND